MYGLVKKNVIYYCIISFFFSEAKLKKFMEKAPILVCIDILSLIIFFFLIKMLILFDNNTVIIWVLFSLDARV